MATITIQSGERAGEQIEIDQDDVTIGRSSDNLIQINDASVSGHHCVISRKGNQYTVEDPGSTNGTRVNGEPIQRQRLNNGDVINAGEINMVIEGDDIEDFRDSTIPPTMIIPRQPQGAPGFQKRRNNRTIWIVLGVTIGLAAAGALVWFVNQLMKS